MRLAYPILLLLALCALPVAAVAEVALPESPGATRQLFEWLQAHPEDATWLAGGSDDTPRAWVELHDSDIVVIMKLPPSVSADDIVKTVMNYDVYARTEDVEVSFQADSVFYTGTKVMGFHSPTVTKNWVRRDGDTMKLGWSLMPEEQAVTWFEQHKPQLGAAMKKAGLDADPDDVDSYHHKLAKKLDTVASVVGSHEFNAGWYRYTQVLELRSRIIDAAAKKLGRSRQYRAGLKAACYSTGQLAWAGAKGQVGVAFETRGNVGEKVLPGK